MTCVGNDQPTSRTIFFKFFIRPILIDHNRINIMTTSPNFKAGTNILSRLSDSRVFTTNSSEDFSYFITFINFSLVRRSECKVKLFGFQNYAN